MIAAAVLAVLALAYLAVCAAGFILQARLVYHPTRELAATPAAIGRPYEDVEIRTADRVRLHGWWLPARPERAVLLCCHGNAGNIADRLDLLRLLGGLGLSVLIFDYRGYGRSGGRVGESGTYRDAAAAWRHLTGPLGIPAERIVLFGRSLGSAVAIELAGRVRPAGLIVEAAFTSLPEVAARHHPWLPVRQLMRIRYDSRHRIRLVRCPKLFLHSPADEVVSYALGLRLYRAAPRPKRFLRLRGGHVDGLQRDDGRYAEGLAGFVDSLGLPPPDVAGGGDRGGA